MLKEIAEQPAAVADTLLGHFVDGRIVLDEQRLSDQELREIDKVFVVACGTAYHSGLLAKYAIEHWTRLPVEVELASEFRYRDPVLDRNTLVVAISQSGETADTLEAVRHAKEQKAKVLAICNTNGSQIPRECDAVLYTRAGPEIGVASTKTFLAQIAANYLVGLALAQARGTKYPDEVAREYRELEAMPDLVARVLDDRRAGRGAGPRGSRTSQTVLFLGRHVGYPVALEGALKLKELAYMHAEGFAAGELKHGPIALIEDGLPVIVVMPSPKNASMLHAKLLSNIREIQARGAITIVIAEEGDDTVRPYADHLIEIPAVSTLFQPLLSTIPLQVFAAGVAQRPRLRRRQAPQPGQVRHRRVVPAPKVGHFRGEHARAALSRRLPRSHGRSATGARTGRRANVVRHRAGLPIRRAFAGHAGGAASWPQRVDPDVRGQPAAAARAAHRLLRRPARRGGNVRAGPNHHGP